MKNQIALTAVLLLISTFSFAQNTGVTKQVKQFESQISSFPLASRVACDEIIESVALNFLRIENPKISIYASNQRDFVNFGCGTADEYQSLVRLDSTRIHASPGSDDFNATQEDRQSRQQMLQVAREEFNARNIKSKGAK